MLIYADMLYSWLWLTFYLVQFNYPNHSWQQFWEGDHPLRNTWKISFLLKVPPNKLPHFIASPSSSRISLHISSALAQSKWLITTQKRLSGSYHLHFPSECSWHFSSYPYHPYHAQFIFIHIHSYSCIDSHPQHLHPSHLSYLSTSLSTNCSLCFRTGLVAKISLLSEPWASGSWKETEPFWRNLCWNPFFGTAMCNSSLSGSLLWLHQLEQVEDALAPATMTKSEEVDTFAHFYTYFTRKRESAWLSNFLSGWILLGSCDMTWEPTQLASL